MFYDIFSKWVHIFYYVFPPIENISIVEAQDQIMILDNDVFISPEFSMDYTFYICSIVKFYIIEYNKRKEHRTVKDTMKKRA